MPLDGVTRALLPFARRDRCEWGARSSSLEAWASRATRGKISRAAWRVALAPRARCSRRLVAGKNFADLRTIQLLLAMPICRWLLRGDHRRVPPKYAGFFLPVKILSRAFRGEFVAGLRRSFARGELDLGGATTTLRDAATWRAFVDALFRTDWVVDVKPAFGGPAAVLRYLGRYTSSITRPE